MDEVAGPEEDFLRRWSRRKHAASQQAAAGADTPAESAAGAPAPAQGEPIDAREHGADGSHQSDAAEALGDEDMPPLDSLGPDSDVSPFFSPRVSESLRQLALQRLFQQPEFNVTDGLDVYCEDFRHYTPLGDIMTSDMRLQIKRAKERLSRLLDEASTPTLDTAETESGVGARSTIAGTPQPEGTSGDDDEFDRST